MEFKTGYDPRRNTRGRPKGTKNSTPAELRSLVTKTATDFFPEIIRALYKLDDDKKVQYGLRLLEFAIPKMREVDNATTLTFDAMTTDQRRDLLQELIRANEAKRSVNGDQDKMKRENSPGNFQFITQ